MRRIDWEVVVCWQAGRERVAMARQVAGTGIVGQ